MVEISLCYSRYSS